MNQELIKIETNHIESEVFDNGNTVHKYLISVTLPNGKKKTTTIEIVEDSETLVICE